MYAIDFLRLFVWYLYPAAVLLFILTGYDLLKSGISKELGQEATRVHIQSDILSTIIWILTSLIIVIYQFKGNEMKLNYSNTFVISLIIAIVSASSWVMSNYKIDIKYIHSLCLISCMAIFFYKCASMYEAINFQYSWFDQNYKHHSIPNNHLKWIIYLIVNIALFIHCFVYLNHCNIVSVRYSFQIISMIVPYFILLIPSNQKYDLYFHRVQMISCIISNIIFKIYLVIDAYSDKKLPPPGVIGLVMIISSLAILPYLMNMAKNKHFVNIVEKNSRILKPHWWEYILSNAQAFDKFESFLLDDEVFENMLFIVEIMQYKYAVLKRLKNNMNTRYPLTFDDETINKIKYISPMAESIYESNLEEISTGRIKIDIAMLCEKYMSNDYDANHKLFVSFIHLKNKKKLKESVYSMINDDEDKNVLNVFDPFIKECDGILQLLYKEYVVRSDTF